MKLISFLKNRNYLVISAVAFLIVSAFHIYLKFSLSDDLLRENSSTIYYSQEDNLLFHQASPSGKLREWNLISNFPDHLIKAVLYSEDRRYYFHPGIDPISFARIFKQFLMTGKLIGGGSTITQQLARILHPEWRDESRFARKIKEIFFALALNLRYSKETILEAYLNSVSIRNNSEGFSIASKRYFGKNIKYLSLEESLGLVVLMRNNYPNEESFHRRVSSLSKSLKLKEEINIGYLESRLLTNKPSSLRTEEIGEENYHFTEWMKIQFPEYKGNILSTLSSELNKTIYEIVQSELLILERYRASNASVVVFEIDPENKNHIRLVSMIGSKNFFDYDAGQVNGSLAYRDAGSILKPLLYARSIDRGLLQPNSIIEDKEFRISSTRSTQSSEIFIPKNADLKFWGDLTLAEALANSRNIPAYRTIDTLGTHEFRKFLEELGFNHFNRSTDFYGHGLAMGTGGASLFQVTYAYSAFLLNGQLPIVDLGKNEKENLSIFKNKQVMKSETAEEIISILRDSDLRKKAFSVRGFLNFPYPIGLKTGTSKDFRNSWTIGFSDRYIVGTWVGNFSGGSMHNVTGNWGAGRIFQSVMRHLVNISGSPKNIYSETEPMSICRKSGLLASDTCPILTIRMRSNFRPKEICKLHNGESKSKPIEIVSPSPGQVFYLSSKLPIDSQKIPIQFRNSNENKNFQIYLDGSETDYNQKNRFNLSVAKGTHRLEIKEQSKTIASVEFNVFYKD
ncbi:MAG: penicillin-binding protein [Leptospira sp.]|nr:penicillin-binding protein [Leptospira sp.]NCS92697.1 penicillin-binding protein [Leptospira sp.]